MGLNFINIYVRRNRLKGRSYAYKLWHMPFRAGVVPKVTAHAHS